MSNPAYPPPPTQFYAPPPNGQSASQQYPPPPSHAPPPQQPSPVSPIASPEGSYGHQQFAPPPQQAAPVTLPYHNAPPAAGVGAALSSAPPYSAAPQEKQPLQHVQQLGQAPAGGAALSAQDPGLLSSHIDDVGSFNGGAYRISHRDTNSVLTVQLAIGCPLHAKPGVMIAMSPSVTLKGEIKFSMKKLISGQHMSISQFIGPGELLLAPSVLGDVTSIRLSGQETWSVGKDAFLACTDRVTKDYKSQGISKAMFSGEGWFTYKIGGSGILWVSSFGAIIRKDLQEGEKYIIDNGHLVAWNCPYIIERIASGGIISNVAAGEGLVCRFTGPGTVFMQTRNPAAMAALLAGQKTTM